MRVRLERILRAAQRAADLTRKMLANTGAETLRADRVDLTQLVDELPHLVGDRAPDSVSIRYELPKGLPHIEGDATQIGQVTMNLVSNALEALGSGPSRVGIRTGETVLADAVPCHVPGLGELAPGHYVFVEVEDSGCGMSPETLARIFDPFFTTKFTGRGLGLAAVLGIVRSHEGGIEIDSRPGQGTRFRVLFPVANGFVAAAPASRRRAKAQ